MVNEFVGKIYLTVKPSHLSAMQTVSLSTSPTPLTSSRINLLTKYKTKSQNNEMSISISYEAK